ncbi:uncharacterized protein LOC120351216, partial [Nilaparvata lugens]|uniref:uncharacterized protein LOC120351216 n=1 Tax=Nilaparvata lugens TaxID=108931 RepID=UPI00193C9EF7
MDRYMFCTVVSPLWVRLLGENKPVSAGQRQEVRCESVGARPVPHLVWWKGSQLLPNSTQETSTDGNRTVSTLRYTPSMDDSDSLLKCRAVDSSSPPHEDTWSLNVR